VCWHGEGGGGGYVMVGSTNADIMSRLLGAGCRRQACWYPIGVQPSICSMRACVHAHNALMPLGLVEVCPTQSPFCVHLGSNGIRSSTANIAMVGPDRAVCGHLLCRLLLERQQPQRPWQTSPSPQTHPQQPSSSTRTAPTAPQLLPLLLLLRLRLTTAQRQ
jgi:hypothetical protein